MSDLQLTIAAASFELGIAAIVFLGAFVGPIRNKAVVAFGAITPAILFMAGIAYEQMTQPALGNMASAGWVTGFAAYTVLLLGGVAISFVPTPVNFFARYLLGLGAALTLLCLLMIF